MRHLHSPQEAAQWLHAQVRGELHTDSRRVTTGDGFIAWPGAASDGRRHVPAALAQGAAACLVEHQGVEAFQDAFHGAKKPGVSDAMAASHALASYTDLKAASGPIAAAYYEQPSRALDVLAITGTNGKTSTAWWLAHALGCVGQRCAVVGTLGVGEVGQLEVTGMTTPDPVLLQARLRDMVTQGVQACAIEASSIGLAEHRLDGTQVRVALFTNFTQDHLDYHGSMAGYWQAKTALFNWPGLQAAVVNTDDAYGAQLAQQLSLRQDLVLWTVGIAADAPQPDAPITAQHAPATGLSFEAASRVQHLQATQVRHGARGLSFDVLEGEHRHTLHTSLVGHYNVSNVLGVIACLRALGHSLAQAVQACADLPAVPGRMQALGQIGQPLVVVDYAHTPDAVVQALQALRPLASTRGGALVCVLGCGGDRDQAKRPLMAAAAEQYADRVVLTSDNPRSEDPQAILTQMLQGLTRPADSWQMLDRAQAIACAVREASALDVVLVAGKGHEDHQDVQGVKLPFSDVAQAQAALQQWRAHV
ncbi:UDP-N-acetylmuramoyl-L-alanyl-D-glutamate--2,6-diaminopimelate ligase [Limnohabitans sp.]|uniref:UDP-N-acetylmuramoyl-L-alanyl-D-glutamate--2, 6-diaminopimelate ligase n=1 Tax=Limnohabitans sp. TaxID=1907725 RepID=UPI0038B80D9B